MVTKLTKVKYSWSFEDVYYQGFLETDNFGAPGSPTQFYLLLTKRGHLSLYLASCPQAQLYITKFKVEAYSDGGNRITADKSGEIHLNRSYALCCSIFDIGDGDDAIWHVHCSITYKEPVVKVDHKQTLSDQLAAYRRNDAHTDVTLVTVADGKEHPAHKMILSMRSPVFATMFRQEGMENVLNRVEIENVKGEVMVAFLDYIYSGDTSKVGQFVGELFELACKYDIKPLAQASIEAITVDNAAQLYYLTDLHQQAELKKKMMDFICEKKMAVKKTTGWNVFIKPNASLLYQLLDYL